ncbi:hypothetical protein Ddye_024565 [Dipteronia dyeriana]|uniref:non-specific serine/threonine protein kinase n=1 Tax=Dipteronia dyeriana TaxID=168575 RepID=A0AAD9TV72_9ROSI|nr:hypothetical protein Ddye_024565 [Dipteronia dyeriana]
MAAAALLSLYFRITFIVCWICLVSAQDEGQFIYEGFNEAKLQIDPSVRIHQNGLLQLTNTSDIQRGHAFHPSPIKFNTSSTQSLSFSTSFVVSINSETPMFGGQGMAFVIAPSMDFSGAESGSYLGLFNISNNRLSTNHILAVELDTVQTPEFKDINGNHVGIDVNSLISNDSAPVTYFSVAEGKNISFNLESENAIEVWIDYRGVEKLLNVTIAPNGVQKPTRPLLSTYIDLSEILLDSMYVGFSASTGTRASDHYILGWSFNTSGQAQNLDKSKLPLPPPLRKTSEKFGESTIIIVVVVAVVVILIIIGGAVYIVRKKKYEEIYEDWEKEYGPQRISYKNLYKATKGFKDEELIGEGGSGKVYRGVLPSSGIQVAVKRVSHSSGQGMKQFVAEIVSMGKLRHRNLVQLRGYCRRRGELLLAYDFMPNGSLDKILYSDIRPNLNWFQRFQILRGVGYGLLYLHEEWEQVVLHRDIKPGNILLDADLNGKLGDFGLARLYDHGSLPETTNVAGTVGYVAPELIRTGQATTSTDVFSFGSFMLEVACGRRPVELQKVDLVVLVLDCWNRGAILDASDPKLEGLYVEEQMKLVLQLGMFCSHPNPATRPSMRQVVQYLDGEARFPDIPSNSNVIDIFKGSNEASSTVISFFSLLEGSSTSQTMSTMGSILEARGCPGEAGIGGALKDASGKILLLFSFYLGVMDSCSAEVHAILKACQLVSYNRSLVHCHISIISDSKSAVAWIKGKDFGHLSMTHLVYDVRNFLQDMVGLDILFKPRASNSLVNSLTKDGSANQGDKLQWGVF